MESAAREVARHGAPSGKAEEVISAAGVLLLAAAALFLLVTTLDASGEPAAGQGSIPPQPQRAAEAPVQLPGVHLFIVAVGAARGDEIAASLTREADLRILLHETPRAAEVIAAADEVEAEAIAEAINHQAQMPGVTPMAAVVVR